jgi:hypothetical protein
MNVRAVFVGIAQYLAAALVVWLVALFLVWATDLASELGVWEWLDAHTGPTCGMSEYDNECPPFGG